MYKEERKTRKFIPYTVSIEVESVGDQIDWDEFFDNLACYSRYPKDTTRKIYEDLKKLLSSGAELK